MGGLPSIRLATVGLALALVGACSSKGVSGGNDAGSDGGVDGGAACRCLPDGGFPDGGFPDGGPPDAGADGGICSCGPPDIQSLDLRLDYAQVDEPGHNLVLVGDFGELTTLPEERIVTVDMTEYQPPRAEWISSSQIIVHNFPSQGPGSAGDIQVNNASSKSNVLQLTEWRGNFRVTWSGTVEIPGSTARIVFDWGVHMRASINGTLGPRFVDRGVDDTACTHDAMGGYTTLDGRSDVTWARDGFPNLPYDPNFVFTRSQWIRPTIDRDRKALQIFFIAHISDGLSVRVFDRMTMQTTTHLERIDFNDGVRDFAIQFDQDWNIPGGFYVQPVVGLYRVEWSTITPNFPPR